jgi:hypothetical protein
LKQKTIIGIVPRVTLTVVIRNNRIFLLIFTIQAVLPVDSGRDSGFIMNRENTGLIPIMEATAAKES